MPRQLARCPVCDGSLQVTELRCGHCAASVRAAFDRCRFCALPSEQYAFLELFLRCEGNLSAVQKELDVSYPTVRSRFAGLLAALGFNGEPAAPSPAAERTRDEPAE